MHSQTARRLPRLAIGVLAAAVALVGVIAGIALGPSAARAATGAAAQDITVTLNPTSGSNYATDTGTLSWTVPSSCVQQSGQTGPYLGAFLYDGTAPWDLATINIALGISAGSPGDYFGNFYNSYPNAVTSATGSTDWPNVASGYQSYESSITYASTSAYVAAEGAGVWTLGVVCFTSTGQPVLDSSGNPVAGSLLLTMNANGSWGIDPATGTAVALTGHGTVAPLPDKASLTATVTANDGSTPAGAVNFYAGVGTSGTPLNGSTPVPVGKNGKATYSGPSGYLKDDGGPQEYTVAFVPANAKKYTPATLVTSIDLIDEDLTVDVTAVQDPSSPATVNLTAHVAGKPVTDLYDELVTGVEFIVDGGSPGTNILLSSTGVAKTQITGVALGSHTISVQVTGTEDPGTPIGEQNGDDITVHPATLDVLPTLTGPKPTITGIAEVGHKLTAHAGTWKPSGVTLTYQWYASGTAISGATKPTYKIAASLDGETIRVKVTGTLNGYATLARYSAPTSPVAG
jgi:hypothetical protein